MITNIDIQAQALQAGNEILDHEGETMLVMSTLHDGERVHVTLLAGDALLQFACSPGTLFSVKCAITPMVFA